ncbi:MAG: hypothetical protein QM731_17405 [Chitinophagaceae bacterium]
MKKILLLGVVAVIGITGCRKIEVDGDSSGTGNNGGNGNGNTGQTITLKGKITKDTVLKAGNTNYLEGLVYITNNATITIEAGAVVQGKYTDPIGGLIITRGAKINAVGTADKPIVFTSASPNPRSGDWAGIVLLGIAPTNASYNGTAGLGEIEGGVNDADGNGLYGKDKNGVTKADDSSGVMKYVRIQYAGYAFLPDKEINSLTLGGVGNKTVIDHIQITYAKDDGIEWFGGTVNCSYLISYKTQDDDFDTDNGFSGRVQFGLIIRDSLIADLSNSEAFESDNDANGSTLTPQTSAVFSNVTAIGPKATLTNKGSSLFLAGAHIRRNTQLSIYNSVFLGWPTGILIDASKGRATDLNMQDSTLRLRYNIIAGCDNALNYAASGTPTGATQASVISWFTNPYFGNSILTNVSDAKFVNPFNYTNLDPTPFGTSPAATGASFDTAKDPKLTGFKVVTFRGGIAPAGDDANWWRGWTIFN